MERITADGIATTDSPLSQAIRDGDTVYVSGQVGRAPDGTIEDGIEDQTARALENAGAILEAAGASLDDVVKATVFLADKDRDFDGFNRVYRERMSEPYPARSAVGAHLGGDKLVEIEVVASV